MRVWVIYGYFLILSCGSGPEQTAVSSQTTDSADTVVAQDTPITTVDTGLNFAKEDVPAEKPPLPPPVKSPSGFYCLLLPEEDGQRILHTISFSSNTFRLQEEFGDKRDSVAITQGTWAPSAGYIWLYRDQVVRGRYTWKGDTLQYYSPRLKKAFSMEKLSPAAANKVWQTKKAEGALIYAVGNEPFWSAEITGRDSLVVTMPDWNAPLKVKVNVDNTSADSTVFGAANDSLQLTVYPFFCNDGMSEFLYTRKIKLVYKGQVYRGCGEKLRAAD